LKYRINDFENLTKDKNVLKRKVAYICCNILFTGNVINPFVPMKFEIEKQTINDLELFDWMKGEKVVFPFFNHIRSISKT
jgi:hypothetical protein